MAKILAVLMALVLTNTALFAQIDGQVVGDCDSHETGAVSNIPASAMPVLQKCAQDIERISVCPPTPQRIKVLKQEVWVVNNHLVKYKVIEHPVSDAKVIKILEGSGLITSRTATWGRGQIADARRRGLVVGRKPGTTHDSPEFNTPASKREMVVVVEREAELREAAIAAEVAARRKAIAAEEDARKKADAEEARLRQLGDEAEAKVRQERDMSLAWGIFFVSILVGFAFLIFGLIGHRH